MHELGIADAILGAVRQEATRHPGARVVAVGLRLGEVAGVEPDALRFCFESLVQQTDLEPLSLELELTPRRHRCPGCSVEFTVKDYEVACPTCGEWRTECIGGFEMDLTHIEVEKI